LRPFLTEPSRDTSDVIDQIGQQRDVLIGCSLGDKIPIAGTGSEYSFKAQLTRRVAWAALCEADRVPELLAPCAPVIDGHLKWAFAAGSPVNPIIAAHVLGCKSEANCKGVLAWDGLGRFIRHPGFGMRRKFGR
jgi:hypothetical protein